MGSVITGDYISSRKKKRPNVKEMRFRPNTPRPLPRRRIGVLPESGEMRSGQKFMQITRFGRDSFATVVTVWGFMMKIGKDTELGGHTNYLLRKERKGNYNAISHTRLRTL